MPVPDAFSVIDHVEGVFGVHIFLGVNRGIKTSCLNWNYEQYIDRLPDCYFPIAGTDTNDLICIIPLCYALATNFKGICCK